MRVGTLSFRSVFRGVIVIAAVFAAGCPTGTSTDGGDLDAGDGDGDGDGDGPLWETAFDLAEAGSISGVWGSGPNDIFVVGGDQAGASITHFDGSSWSAMAVPAEASLLIWAFGFGPADVYAVGLEGTALHYDGTSWSTLLTGTEEELWGVWGRSSDDVWVVGGDVNEGAPILQHWDGTVFTPYVLPPAQNPNEARSLFKVWGIGEHLFSVGQNGLIVKFDGTDWLAQDTGPLADDDFVSLWGNSEEHIVAVGGRGNARIAVWNGSAWTTSAPTGVAGLNAVFMQANGTVHVGGVWGLAAIYDVEAESFSYETTHTRLDLHSMWGDGQGRIYAVGGSFFAPHIGVALKRVAP